MLTEAIAAIHTAMAMGLAWMEHGRYTRTPPAVRVGEGEEALPRVVAQGITPTMDTAITVAQVDTPPVPAPQPASIATMGSTQAAMGIQCARLVPRGRMPPTRAVQAATHVVQVGILPTAAHRVALAAARANTVALAPRTAPRALLVKPPPPAPPPATLTRAPQGNI